MLLRQRQTNWSSVQLSGESAGLLGKQWLPKLVNSKLAHTIDEMKSALFLFAVCLALSGCTSWEENKITGYNNLNMGWNSESVVSQQVHQAQLEHDRKLRNRRTQRQQAAQEELMQNMYRWQDGQDELIRSNGFFRED